MKSDPEPIRKILSSNIKKYRAVLHYSQEKLAEKSGLSAQTLNDIEGCRRWISAKTITKLAKALNIEEFQLLFPENDNIEAKNDVSSIKALLSLQEKIRKTIDSQFEEAIDTGSFK
jgi:transcriptional regulator with XRE-family HTH domain